MKGLGKVVFAFAVVTSVFLLYVHERVEIFRTSYRIQRKSSELSKQSEEFRRLSFEVTQLRSPQYLEGKLEELSLPLTVPQQIQVLRVPEAPKQAALPSVPLSAHSPNLFDFLGQWIQVAQARTDQ
jgi:hypothetical protein